jgi:hypothetical protein
MSLSRNESSRGGEYALITENLMGIRVIIESTLANIRAIDEIITGYYKERSLPIALN